MARTITTKQRKWADKKLKTGNGTKAALDVYDTKDYNTAAVIASENLKKPNVLAYIESRAQRAAEITYEIAESGETDQVRLSAAKDIQDRAGLKPVEKSQSISVNYDVRTSDPVLEEARKNFDELYKQKIVKEIDGQ